MSPYAVKTDIFEGPFDLLLHLVGRQKLDIHDISISEIADEFIGHIERMRDLDLDVASDFLLVAATLLEIKSARLIPTFDMGEDFDEFEDLSPEEARELLIERLLTYKQFKNVSAELSARMDAVGRMHAREAGLEEPFLAVMPDYLENVTLRELAVTCAALEHKREIFLLQAEHVASMPISLEEHMDIVRTFMLKRKRTTFSELLTANASPEVIVVTFLAILELYKSGAIDLKQSGEFAEIEVVRKDKKGLRA